ncbi:MAG TPA: cytochrome c biogenesis protein CcdA [Candidatus Paceibacterota bacterium]|nr:cytochrome c biogenesis protein CcdA [Candidatus Paceibacterota bacterium]
MLDISFPIAFLAGLASFASPCVLPIIPGFLAYIAGTSLGEGSSDGGKRRDIFLSSLFFVLGFSVVFALLGVLLNTALANVAYGAQAWLARIGGTVIILFGLYLTGLLPIPWLGRAHTMKVSARGRSRHLTSFLFGFAFAAGWTPCVGAILGAIIALAAAHPGSAFLLLLSYSVGLGVPFLAVGLFAGQAACFIERHARVFALVSKAFGAVLIVLGVLVFTQELSRVANFDFVNNLLIK